MKKLFVSILTLALMLSLVACGNKAGNEDVTKLVSIANEELEGGWSTEITRGLTRDAKKALRKATDELTGAEYEMQELVATQVVAGTNYLILCKQTPVVPNPTSTYCLVTVYEDLDGNATITEIEDLETVVSDNAEV